MIDEVALWVALAAPVVGLVPALLALDLRYVGRWSRLGGLAGAAGWVVVLARGRRPELGLIEPDSLAAAAGVGAGLLMAALPRAPVGIGVAVSALTVGLAATTTGGGTERPAAVAAGLGLAAATALAGANRPLHPWPLAAGGLGAAAAIAGLAAIGDTSGWAGTGASVARPATGATMGAPAAAAGVALAVGCVVLAVAASTARRSLVVVLPGVFVVALRGLPWLGERGIGAGAAVVLAAVAVVVAAGWRAVAPSPTGALAVWAVVCAIDPVPGLRTASGLLAAGAVLAVLVGGPLAAAVTGLPGAVAAAGTLASALADEPGWEAVVLAGLLLATAASAAGRLQFSWVGGVPAEAAPATDPARPGSAQVVGLALVAWLTFAPGAWHWVGAAALDDYHDSVAVAAAAALVAIVGVPAWRASRDPDGARDVVRRIGRGAAGALIGTSGTGGEPSAHPNATQPSPVSPVSPVAGLVALVTRPNDHSQWAAVACLAGLVALGIAAAVLVASAVV